MEDDQQFCLRWNNHQSTLIQNFDTLLESGTLVDCTLAAEGKYLKAHKVVLSACSPYFEGLLSEHYDKHPVFILKDVKFKELKAMMDYMYRGEVNISQDQLSALLKAAESLQIKGLSDSRTGGSGGATTGKADTRPLKTASSTTASSSVDIPHGSSGLTIEKNSKVPRQSLQQVSVSDLPEDSASPQLRGFSSREGSQSPTRKKKRLRKRSLGNDDNNSMENHEASNSSDVNISAPALGVAPVADEKSHADPADSIGRSALMQQLTKPADEMLQIPIEKPEPSEEMIQPKSEYLDDQESVEDLTNLDDDMNDLNEMEQDNSRAGPSHDPSQHPGLASWHIAGDRSNASVVGAAAGPPGSQDEVFLAAHEAAQAQRDSQDKRRKKVRKFVRTNSTGIRNDEKEIAEIIIDDNASTVREVHYVKEQAVYSSESSDEQDEAYDALEINDSNFELTYCLKCDKSTKLVSWRKDLKCKNCKSSLEYKCERCNKMYKRIKSLRFHLRHDCNKDPSYHCDHCDYKSTRKASLQIHVKCKHTRVNNKQFHKCPRCGKGYKHRFHMLGHQKQCGSADIKCESCEFKTKKPANLKQHVRNIHTDLNSIEFHECRNCGKMYKHSKTLYKHRKSCGMIINRKCAHCDFCTNDKFKLLVHLRKSHADVVFAINNPLNGRSAVKRKKVTPKRYTE